MEALVKALNTLPVSAVFLDASGTIVAANDTWKEFGRRNGLRIPNSGVGASYLKYSGGKGLHSTRFVRDLRNLLAGRLDLLTAIYPCHSPRQKRWFLLVGVPFPLGRPTGAALLHVNLTTMLKAPLAQREEHETAGKEQKKYSGLVHSDAHLERIGDAIEQSVSETLSGQIMAMLQGSAFSRLQSTPFASEQTWARSDAPPALPAPHRKGAGADASAKVSEHLDIPEDAELNDVIARAGLSKRQVDVLRLLGKGMTNREIAEALFRSPHTIKLHVSAILERLHLKSRTQAALLASKL